MPSASACRTDQQLTKNSYYAATAPREQRFAALQVERRLRRRRRRRRAGRPVGGDRAGRPRLQRRAARGPPGRLGRLGPQRRPGDRRPGLRPVGDRGAARPRRRAARLGHDARGDPPDRRALRALRHRLRLARRLPRAWPSTNARRASCAAGTSSMQRDYGYETTWIDAAGHAAAGSPARASTAACTTRARRPPAPAQVQPGPGARRGRAGRAASSRTRPSPRSSPGPTRAAAHRRTARCAPRTCCWPATSTCRAWRRRSSARIMPVGTYIVASEPLEPALAALADPVAARRCATPTSCSTTSARRRTTACSTAAASATAPPRR